MYEYVIPDIGFFKIMPDSQQSDIFVFCIYLKTENKGFYLKVPTKEVIKLIDAFKGIK